MSRAVTQTLQPVYQRDILLETDKESLPVTADEERIKQLLTILLDNAIKYSEKAIVISAGTKDGQPFLSVRDEGIGIPEEHIRICSNGSTGQMRHGTEKQAERV